MKCRLLLVTAVTLLVLGACNEPASTPAQLPIPSNYTNEIENSTPPESSMKTIKLPEPRLTSESSLEETLLQRRSVREYSTVPLTLEEVAQILWAAQGITSDRGYRTAPSAGALYPLEVYLVVGNVADLAAGVYQYKPQGHEIINIKGEDIREKLASAALNQSCVKEGAIVIAITAVYTRTTEKYGDRGIKYVHIEAGHAAQNICLQVTALDLGAVTIGAFHDNQVKAILGIPDEEVPLYLIPIGRKI